MALFYVYYFFHGGEEQAIYAVSEVEARKGFKDIFKADPGKLIRRDRW